MAAIRAALDSEGFTDVSIMAYTAKYAVSNIYYLLCFICVYV